MKIKEMIEQLKKHPNQNAEVVLWVWGENGSMVHTLEETCNQNMKEFFLLKLPTFPYNFDPNFMKYQEIIEEKT